ncbi:DUF1566 domain-containing protein [candidate division KSB1 bacterium]|nr:DUF1566 domain-containing protein [candidate division KSB1 bacterium]
MPFRKELKTVYTEAIKTACDKAGFKAVRADELIGPFNIHRDIIEYIFSSDAIIADLTDWNPNVFYELGVAHAVANKTIMIVQKGQELPFDIHNYRCIAYDLSEPGLRALAYQVGEYLEHLEAWSKRPTNPVQEFKREDLFITPRQAENLRRELRRQEEQLKNAVPKAELERVQQELQSKEARLRESVPTAEVLRLQKALQEKEAAFVNSIPKSEWQTSQKRAQELGQRNETLRRENEALRVQNAQPPAQGYDKRRVQLVVALLAVATIILATQVFKAAEPFSEKPSSAQRMAPLQSEEKKDNPAIMLRRSPWLRATPATLNGDQVKNMLGAKGFYDKNMNESGAGIKNDFELKVITGDSLVLDHETGLIWQQSGSLNYITYAAAEQFVRDVNNRGFGGFTNWRLLTLEEAMSLMEGEKKNGNLYIDPVFDRTQSWIWTSDKSSESSCWVAGFADGYCFNPRVDYNNYVRLVR